MASIFSNAPNSSTNVLVPRQSQPAPVVDIPALQAASRVLQDQLMKDAQIIPDLGEMFASSGQSASYSIFPDDYRVPFQKRRLVGIPEGLFEYYTAANVTSHMGLLPDMERVWITIDHKLFLWDYVEGEELSSFADQPDVITHVAAVKPKPGVFIDEISHLLVLCTPISVLLLGVSVSSVVGADNRPRKDIKMYATDMSISTDVEMTSVVGTPEGRIFMCGSQDGCLYELHYQEKEGWFGKRVQLINHSVGGVQTLFPKIMNKSDDRIISVVSDLSRNCFYTLSNRSTISVYKTNGDKAIQQLQTLNNIYKLSQDKAPASPALTPKIFNIVALHVLDPTESRSSIQLHVVAVTSNGIRLYLSPQAGYGNYGFASSGGSFRPLGVQHVRLPPTNLLHPDEQSNPHHPPVAGYGLVQIPQQQNSRPYTISSIENSCYSAGLMVATQQGDSESMDYILCLSSDLTKIGAFGQVQPTPQQQPPPYANTSYGQHQGSQRPPLTEHATVLAIPGRTWAMAPAPREAVESSSGPLTPIITNELAYQFSEPTRYFMILTNVGLTYLAKRRALDYLKDVVEEAQDGNAQPVIQFRDSFGRDQTCAMLLAMASGNTFMDLGEQSGLGKPMTVSTDLSNAAKQVFYDFGERPMWAERSYGSTTNSGTAIFSGRREGLAMYFARLVRPFWKSKLVKPGPFGLCESNVRENTYLTVQKNLYALKDFLDKNPQLFHSTPGDQAGVRGAASSEQEAWKAEQNSVAQLLALLTRTIEAISFVLLLIDHRLGELIAQCDQETQKSLSEMTFEELVTGQSGVLASRALVNVVIDQQIGQQISVDTISDVLQQRCGSFCSTDDVMLYKAKENVRKAVETTNSTERQNWLSEALRLFVKGARVLEFDKLREVCGDFQQLNYAKGAVELPLSCAQVVDPDGLGWEYWHSGAVDTTDPRYKFWEARRKCYELILDSLSAFDQKAGVQAPAGPGSSEAVRSHAYELTFSSDDELFHSTLYDWLISRGLADELLEMRPAYLEAHLKREPGTVQKYQLLWQFYVKDGQPLRAAEVLAALAESTHFDLTLEARLEYLTLAVGNAKSHPVAVGGRHEDAIAFLTDLEEKLEVAQVQLEIYHTLTPRSNEPGEVGEKIRFLTTRLCNITELYQGFAEPFDLPIMKLIIYHVSEHRDENLVRPIWSRIFDEALDGVNPKDGADRLLSKIVPLGQRFYPSESAFPLRHIATLLVRFSLLHKSAVSAGWAPRILVQCGVPYPEIWDIIHGMYESQIPPFNLQENVQSISSDISILLNDWLEEAKRPQSSTARDEFPVYRIDQAVDQYLAELEPGASATKAIYENIKRQLRRSF